VGADNDAYRAVGYLYNPPVFRQMETEMQARLLSYSCVRAILSIT
jgi:hypothetical protein